MRSTLYASCLIVSALTAARGATPLRPQGWSSPLLTAEAKKSGLLYVSEAGYDVVDIYTKSIPNQLVGQITSGICLPVGLTADAAGNVYVASYYAECSGAGPSVTVFPPGATTPSQTAFAAMYDPDQVAIRPADGAVTVSDYGGNVLEYRKGSLKLEHIYYKRGGLPLGVAFDHAGNLTMSYTDEATQTGRIAKYDTATHSFTDLGISLVLAGAIAFDTAGNLLVEDQRGGTVEVFPPGATTPSKTFTGFSDPFTMALDNGTNILYVADLGTRRIDEISYPSGKRLGAITGFAFNTFGVAVTQPSSQAGAR